MKERTIERFQNTFDSWNTTYDNDMKNIDKNFYYDGDDLGSVYMRNKTTFRIWAPTAVSVALNLYEEGLGSNLRKQIIMEKGISGTFYLELLGDHKGVYYTYQITLKDIIHEVMDPYAKAAGANGERAMVIDLEDTNPEGFKKEKRPTPLNPTDSIIYELHIRDLSTHPSSHIKNVGKFIGLTETGTKNDKGLSTGLDHIKELGITHLHLLPVFDFGSVDETKLDTNQFNWGYDPKNYNVPEGSYSTNPYQGEVRIKEFKEMVMALHENGIRVVLDVVYNHTERTEDSNFNKIVPNYYYRMKDGKFSDGSGCGNEIASERLMVRKYIIDSVFYWAREYHIDGFRFDLMGLHDIETMNVIRTKLDELDKSILMYGEGWGGGNSLLPEKDSANKINNSKLDRIAAFSDDIRDSVKGSVFNYKDAGYVNGRDGIEEDIKYAMVGSVGHKQVKGKVAWAVSPEQCINYVSAHDDLTLWDKLSLSAPKVRYKKRIRMNQMACAIVFTSQGIPFFQAGEELLRTKPGDEVGEQFDHNSFKSSDEVNNIKWNDKTKNPKVFDYYKGLIEFRKEHPSLRLKTKEEVEKLITFYENLERNVVAYIIEQSDKDKAICIIHNPRKRPTKVQLPEGIWDVYIDGERSGTKVIKTITKNFAKVSAVSSMVLVRR